MVYSAVYAVCIVILSEIPKIYRILTKHLHTQNGFEDFISNYVCTNNILDDVSTLIRTVSTLQVLELTGKYPSLNAKPSICKYADIVVIVCIHKLDLADNSQYLALKKSV